MLYSIQINTYNSVDAPSDCGISAIEMWFAGMQIPILLAVMEYGIILAMKKFSSTDIIELKGITMNKEILYKYMDLATFALSITYFIIFNGFYWFYWF